MLIICFTVFIPLSIALDRTHPSSYYHNDAEIDSFINKITQHPNIKSCGDQKYLHIGESNNKVIITCNVHARQYITTQLCLHFVNYLYMSSNIGSQFFVFYNANQNRQNSLNGHYCIRKNYNDTDLNRNYPTGFRSGNKEAEDYGGQYPLSQELTVCIDSLADKQTPLLYLDIHSGQFNMYYTKTNNTYDSQILNALKQKYCKACRVTGITVNESKSTDAKGQAFTDMRVRKNITYSYLFEIYGGYSEYQSMNEQCFTIFNPRHKRELQFWLDKWLIILNALIEEIIKRQS